MRKELEKDIQKAIIDYLRLKKYVVFKHHSTGFTASNGEVRTFRYGDRGIADIIGCSPTGRFVAIEVKRKGGKISDDQTYFLDSIRRIGGIAFVAFSLDDAIAQIESPGNVPVSKVHG